MTQSGKPHVSGRPLLFAGFVVTGFVTTVLGPVLPWLTARWGLSDAAAGALFTIQFSGSIIAGGLSGMIIARLGASTTLATGYALMAAGLTGLAFGDRLVGTSAMAVAGVGLGFVVPATNLMVARLTPAHAAAALGAVNLCWGLGAATWPIIVGRFNPVPGVHVALLVAAVLHLAVAARMSVAKFPIHALQDHADAPPVAWNWRRLTVYGFCFVLYSGIEAAFGGWITEYTRRLATDTPSMRWETAASAFWGGLAGGRGIVATGVARRVENPAVFAGLVMVGISIASLLAAPQVSLVFAVAVICGLGFSPSFPVTMAGLSREVPPKVAQPMIALGSLGAGIVPWMVGAISSRTGSLTAGLSALLLLLAVLIGMHVLRVKNVARPVTH